MNIKVVFLLLATASLLQDGWCQPIQNSCPIVTAPDGSNYDLSYISDRVQQAVSNAGGTTYTFNISICDGPLSEGCAGACSSPNTGGVCMFWGPAPANAKCYGMYNTGQVVGLNNGFGVRITYQGGDVCGSCNPSGPRSSVITLKCRYDGSDPSVIQWTSVYGAEPMQPPIVYINGTFNCAPSTPSIYNPKKHISTQYIGYGSGCNGTDAYMVTVNRTPSCTPGCLKLSNTYVYTVCDQTVHLPSGTWIERINYNSNTTCDTPESAVYTQPNQCTGHFEFSYQNCDAATIYTYSCGTPYCNQCTMSSKISTGTCVNGMKYFCASDKKQPLVYDCN